MKKILKTITFLSLAMCLMLNTNIVHATKDTRCPRNTRSGVEYWKNGKGTDFRTEYYDHDILEIWANADKGKRERLTKIATEAGSSIGGIVGGKAGKMAVVALGPEAEPFAIMGEALGKVTGKLAGGFTTSALLKNWKTNGERWLDSSKQHNYCGVKLHVYRTPIGTWIYYGFDPQ